jgi:hypothetical protein
LVLKDSVTCDYDKKEFEPRRQGRRQRFCPGGKCRKAFYAEARRKGANALRRRSERPVDLEEARQDPAFQRKVAEVLAWAEAQHPATPEAWGIKIEKQADGADGADSGRIANGGEIESHANCA